MKKLAIVVVCLFSCSLAWGQSNQKIITWDDDFALLTMPKYSSDGICRLCKVTYSEDAMSIQVLDDDFNVDRCIIPIQTTNTIYVQRKEREAEVTIVDEQMWPITGESFTLESAKEFFIKEKDEYFFPDITEIETREDGVYFFSATTRYEKPEDFGTLYPTESFYLLDKAGQLFYVFRSYNVCCTGNWIEKDREESKIYAWDIYGEKIDYIIETEKTTLEALEFIEQGDFSNPNTIFITQTLFNDDDKYEYNVPISNGSVSFVESDDRDYDMEIDRYTKYYGYAVNGFNVVSEDGTILFTINYEGGFVGGYSGREEYKESICLAIMNNKPCLIVGGYIIDENNYTQQDAILIYEIDKQSNSIKQVAKHVGMTVRPTVADESEQITVDLSEESDVTEIVVINAAGQTLKRIPVSVGQKKVSFNAQGMSRGLNVVNTRGGKDNLSSKVLIK